MWRRISSYGDGYVPRSLLEQEIVSQSWHYEWSGGEPDPGQLPEGYKQLPHDKARARRILQTGDKLVCGVIAVLALFVALLVVRAI